MEIVVGDVGGGCDDSQNQDGLFAEEAFSIAESISCDDRAFS